MSAVGEGARRALRLAAKWVPHPAAPPLETWALSRTERGELAQRGHALSGVLERHGSPVHLVDREKLEQNLARFAAAPPGAVRCEVFYSYKTNPVPGVLKALHACGAGAEVVSPYELWLALRLKVPPARIVYNGPAKTDGSLEQAIAAGVGLINVNCRAELGRVAEAAQGVGRRARVGVRVVVPGAAGGQFGERIDDGAALYAYERALLLPDLEVVGLHTHLNGELATIGQLDALLDGVLGFAATLKRELGLALEIIDLGGNLGCPTVSHRTPLGGRVAVALGRDEEGAPASARLGVEEYAAHVGRRVAEHFDGRGEPRARVFVEPGRAVSSDAQLLLCSVVEVRDPDHAGVRWAVLDAGINVAEALRAEHHHVLPLLERGGEEPVVHRLVGPSCSLGDLLVPACELPPLRRGDALAIMDTGAYFVPFSTCFSFPRPAVVMLDGGREVVLRRRETFDDLVSLDGGLAGGL